MAATQATIEVKVYIEMCPCQFCVDRDVRRVGQTITVPIEPQATVRMLKQEVAEWTFEHPTKVHITFGRHRDGEWALADDLQLQDIDVGVNASRSVSFADALGMGYFFTLSLNPF